MNILITIDSKTELQCYEAAALALTLATFDHNIQLWISNSAFDILLNANSRFTGMIKSLDLYDIAPAWIDKCYFNKLTNIVDNELKNQLAKTPNDINLNMFDEVLSL